MLSLRKRARGLELFKKAILKLWNKKENKICKVKYLKTCYYEIKTYFSGDVLDIFICIILCRSHFCQIT